ncbi:MAG: hypothetical protein EB127_32000, partial [Alphaproteobacteria bacterium]|nr:hypothetical protein [Alphaproteobacteria bacterium]
AQYLTSSSIHRAGVEVNIDDENREKSLIDEEALIDLNYINSSSNQRETMNAISSSVTSSSERWFDILIFNFLPQSTEHENITAVLEIRPDIPRCIVHENDELYNTIWSSKMREFLVDEVYKHSQIKYQSLPKQGVLPNDPIFAPYEFSISESSISLSLLSEKGWLYEEIVGFYCAFRNRLARAQLGYTTTPNAIAISPSFYLSLVSLKQRARYNYEQAVASLGSAANNILFNDQVRRVIVPCLLKGPTKAIYHWVMVCLDFRDKQIMLFDSQSNDYRPSMLFNKFIRFLSDFAEKFRHSFIRDEWKLENLVVAQQSNAIDCGVYMIMNVDLLMEDALRE